MVSNARGRTTCGRSRGLRFRRIGKNTLGTLGAKDTTVSNVRGRTTYLASRLLSPGRQMLSRVGGKKYLNVGRGAPRFERG